MSTLSRQEQVWNRACLESGGPAPAAGDRALAAMLSAHGLAMNGGVAHALEVLDPQSVAAAVAGFEYFGLTDAARIFERSYANLDSVEEQLDREYGAVVPDDNTLVQAYRVKLLSNPEAFAPVRRGAYV